MESNTNRIDKLEADVYCQSDLQGYPAENVLDDSEKSWRTAPYYQWILLDLKRCCHIERIRIVFSRNGSEYYHYHIQYSTDRINWEDLFEKSDDIPEKAEGNDIRTEKEARYIRLTVSYHSGDRFVEVSTFAAYGYVSEENGAGTEAKELSDTRTRAVCASSCEGFSLAETEELEPGWTETALTSDKPGSWFCFKGTDFKDGAYDQLRLLTGITFKSKQHYLTVSFRLDSPDGKEAGRIHLTRQWQNWSQLAVDLLDGGKRITGVHDLYVVLTQIDEPQQFWVVWMQLANRPELSREVLDYHEDLAKGGESDEYRVFFGDMHSHTSFSDGSATPEFAYDYARNVAKMDFLGITEHSNCLDEAFDCCRSRKFRDIRKTAEAMTENDKFVCLYGSETTFYNQFGHMNIYCADFFLNSYEFRFDSAQEYYRKLKEYPYIISQWNHPWSCGDRHLDMFRPYDAELDKITYTIELCDVENTEDKVLKYYVAALDEGWHIAPVGNQDNHREDWGTQNGLRTAVIAKRLTAGHIYDAVKNLRVYYAGAPGIRVLF